MRIGVISDTHGLFDPKVRAMFKRVDLIVHAGDIGRLDVISQLQEIAPVLAVEGNNDSFGEFPEERFENLEGRRFWIRHIFGELHQLRVKEKTRLEELHPDVVVFGHSHRPYQHLLGKTLLFNPGSAGPRRFSLPRTVGMLSLKRSGIDARIVSLD